MIEQMKQIASEANAGSRRQTEKHRSVALNGSDSAKPADRRSLVDKTGTKELETESKKSYPNTQQLTLTLNATSKIKSESESDSNSKSPESDDEYSLVSSYDAEVANKHEPKQV